MKPLLLNPLKFAVTLFMLLLVRDADAQTPVIDSMQKITALAKSDTAEIIADMKLAEEYARINIPLAKQYAFNAVALTRQLNLPFRRSLAYTILVTLNAQTSQTDSAKYYLALIDKMAENTGDVRIRTSYNFAAGLFYRKQGNYKTSQPFMLAALKDYALMNSRIDIAGQNLNVGNNYSDMGQYRSAVTYHLKALTLFTELGSKRGMSFTYGSIGNDLIKVRQFTAALPYIQRSITLKNELKDQRGIATSYISLGEIQEGLNEPGKALASYKKALASYKKALEINKAMKLTIEEAKTDFQLAKFYAGQEEVSNAGIYFDRSRDLFRQLGDSTDLAAINAEVAGMQNNISKQKTAERTFLNTLATSQKMGDRNTEISTYKYLADLYAKNKLYDKALLYNEKYHTVSDSVNNEDLQLQVQALEQQFNIEKNEKEIKLLKQSQQLDKVSLQKQKLFRYGTVIFILMLMAIGFLIFSRYKEEQKGKRLVEIEKMRNLIARNLHDDIGSTLSSINILSKVALKQADGNTSVTRDLEKIKDSSFAIMESMSDIVWAINPINDPLDQTILKMREFAAGILEPAGIPFTFTEEGKILDLKLGVDARKNLYLIFKEAVNNIAKYSGATLADIKLHKNTHQFLLTITDSGKGFDPSTTYSGNGLKNMRIRADEMKAAFEITSEPGTGTRIMVAVPIA